MPESWPNLRSEADVKKKPKGPQFDKFGAQLTKGEAIEKRKKVQDDPDGWRDQK